MSEYDRIERRAMWLLGLLVFAGWLATMLWIWMMQP